MNKSVSRLCLFLSFMIVSSCSESGKDDVTDVSAQELAAINYSLKDYMFMRRYFDEPDRVNPFLQELVAMHYNSYLLVASSETLRSIEQGGISSWLRAKEKREAVLRKLCSDPQFVFEGNKWKVTFNVFKKDGGVDQWRVVGEHYPPKKYNQVEKIEISTLKPKGTFFWPMMG